MTSQDDKLPDFDGKVVSFYCANIPPDCAVALVSPSFEQQAGRLFVVGKTADQVPPHWDGGLQSAIGWDQVSSYVVFDSLDVYQARMSSCYKNQQTNVDGDDRCP